MRAVYERFATGATAPTAPKMGTRVKVLYDDGRTYVETTCLDWFGEGSGNKSAEAVANTAIERRVLADLEDML